MSIVGRVTARMHETWSPGLQVTEYDKQFSAYMLFYERADELEPIDQLRQVSLPAADDQASAPASTPAAAAAEEAAAGSTPAADSMAPSEPIFSRLVDVSSLRCALFMPDFLPCMHDKHALCLSRLRRKWAVRSLTWHDCLRKFL